MAHDNDQTITIRIPQLDEALCLLRMYFFRKEVHMAEIDTQLAALTAEVSRNTDVDASVLAALAGNNDKIIAAVQAALAAGATPAQLQAVTDATTAIKANNDALAAAVTTNTPAA